MLSSSNDSYPRLSTSDPPPSTPLSPRPKGKAPAFPSARIAAAVAAFQNGGAGLRATSPSVGTAKAAAGSGGDEQDNFHGWHRTTLDAETKRGESLDGTLRSDVHQRGKLNADTFNNVTQEGERSSITNSKDENVEDDDDDDGTSTQMTHTTLSASTSSRLSKARLAVSTSAMPTTSMEGSIEAAKAVNAAVSIPQSSSPSALSFSSSTSPEAVASKPTEPSAGSTSTSTSASAMAAIANSIKKRIGMSPMSEDGMSNHRLSIDQASSVGDRTFGRTPTPSSLSDFGRYTPQRKPLPLGDMSPASQYRGLVSPSPSSVLDRTLSLTDQELASIVLTDGEGEEEEEGGSSLLQLPDEEPSEYVPPTMPKVGGFGVGTDRVKPHREGMRSKATERAAKATTAPSQQQQEQASTLQTPLSALAPGAGASSSTLVNKNGHSIGEASSRRGSSSGSGSGGGDGNGNGLASSSNGLGGTSAEGAQSQDDVLRRSYERRRRSATDLVDSTPPLKQSQMAWGENFWCVVEQPKGQSFFANPQSGECAWAVPSGTFVLPPQAGGQWWELYDEERDLPYFFQTKTRETSWERPKAFVIPMAAIQQSTLGKRFSQTEFDGGALAALGSMDQISELESGKQHQTGKRRIQLQESERQREVMSKGREKNASETGEVNASSPRVSDSRSRRKQPPPPLQEPKMSRPPGGSRHKPRRSQSSRTLRELQNASLSTAEARRNGSATSAASAKPLYGRGATLPTILSSSSLPRRSVSSSGLHPPQHDENNADLMPPPASFELRRIVRRERDPVKRKRMAALAVAATQTPPLPLAKTPTTKRLSTGDHKILPADLRRDIQAFAMESYAKRHFAVHRSGLLRRKTPLEKLLKWQKQPITSPYLALEDAEIKKDAVRGFKVIMRIMGDRVTPVFWPKVPSSSSIGSGSGSALSSQAGDAKYATTSSAATFGTCIRGPHEQTTSSRSTDDSSKIDASGPTTVMEMRWLLERGIASGSGLRDEIFIQTMKQLTSNPRMESRRSGWEWMCVLLVTFAPSRDLHSHLQSFIKRCADSGPLSSSASTASSSIRRGRKGENAKAKASTTAASEEEAIMARYCLGRLAIISRRGSNTQAPTLAEIECASEAAFHPGVFGQTLPVIMQRQADVYPEAKVPIVLTFLTDAMLAMDALKTPSVFRAAGDPDLMTQLRVRIEKGHYSLVGLVSQLDGDVSVLASLLKLWFRELEEPLFPASLYYRCLEAAAISNQAESVEACLRIVRERLPRLNKRVVAFTISFLQLFCSSEQVRDKTRLSVETLAGIFAPNLLLCPHLLDEQQDGSTKLPSSLQAEVDEAGVNGAATDYGRLGRPSRVASASASATDNAELSMTLKKNAMLEQRFLVHLLIHLDCSTLCNGGTGRKRHRNLEGKTVEGRSNNASKAVTNREEDEEEEDDEDDFVPMHGHGSPTGALASGQEFEEQQPNPTIRVAKTMDAMDSASQGLGLGAGLPRSNSAKRHGITLEQVDEESITGSTAPTEDEKATWEIMSLALRRGDGNVPKL